MITISQCMTLASILRMSTSWIENIFWSRSWTPIIIQDPQPMSHSSRWARGSLQQRLCQFLNMMSVWEVITLYSVSELALRHWTWFHILTQIWLFMQEFASYFHERAYFVIVEIVTTTWRLSILKMVTFHMFI